MHEQDLPSKTPPLPHLSELAQQIAVTVRCFYLDEQSQPAKKQYVFGYTIRIENQSADTIQLLYRHWLITEGDSKIKEVRGPGVVGEQPVIAPGQAYSYSSGAVIDTHFGTMAGSYDMVNSQGERFAVTIPAFLLITPSKLN